jgi:hypothetical protein
VTTVVCSFSLHLYRGHRDGVRIIVVFISAYCIDASCAYIFIATVEMLVVC